MRRAALHAKPNRLFPDSRPRRLTVVLTASAVLVTGGGAAGVALAWPAAAAAGHPGAAAAPSPASQLLISDRSQLAPVQAAPQLRRTELAAQRQLAARQARAAARRAAAQRAERLAAEQRAAAPSPAPSAPPSPAPSPAPSQPAPPAPSGSPQHIALGLLGSYGWPSSQFSCLDPLWEHESGWSVTAANASGAYGIPQALPGSKMASAGPDWQTDAATQIRWGLGYIKSIYGSPCGAWAHEQSAGWY
jgi:hypothetical protein